MSLCTVSDIRAFLNIQSDDANPVLDICRESAERSIKDYLDSNIESATYTHYFDGTALRDIVLRQRPVTSIVSVYIDQTGYYGQSSDPFPATTLLEAGRDYALVLDDSGTTANISRSGLLRRIGPGDANFYSPFNSNTLSAGTRGATWMRGLGNVKVTYVAGWPTVPAAIRQACISLASLTYNNRAKAGLQVSSESLGSYSYSLLAGGAGGMSPELMTARQLLAAYREVRI